MPAAVSLRDLRHSACIAVTLLAVSCVRQDDATGSGENHRARLPARSWRISDTPLLTVSSTSFDTNATFSQVAGALRMTNGSIVVGDGASSSAKVFDSGGRFVRSVGRRGDGPNELRNLRSVLRYGNDHLLLSDARGRAVVLDSSGSPISTITLGVTNGVVQGVFADSTLFVRKDSEGYIFLSGPSGAGMHPAYRFLLNREGVTVDSVGPFTLASVVGSGELISEVLFGATTSFAVDGENFYVANSGDYSIAVFARDGTPVRAVQRRWAPMSLSDADISGFVEAMVARAEPNRQQALRSALTPDFFSRRLPAFSGIVVDGEGYLWVEAYDIDRGLPPAARRDTVSKTKAWSIFDRSGVWECDVLLPRDLKVTDIGRDYVLGFRLDPDGLPELMLYGLVRR
jgi:hypothetical protein